VLKTREGQDAIERRAKHGREELLTGHERGGGLGRLDDQEREARVGKMLESDYQNGGQLIDYLQRGDVRMSRDAYDAVRKYLSSSEADADYAAYEEQQARVVKAPSGNDDDGNGGADADADDDKEKRSRSKSGKTKYKSGDDGMRSAFDGDDGDDEDDEDDDEDGDDDDMEKLRRKGLRSAKLLGLTFVTSDGIRKGAPSKLCQGCRSENTISSPRCQSCSTRFGKTEV